MDIADVAELPTLPETPPKPVVFKIESDELKKLLRLAHIQTSAPLVDVDVTLTDLHCTVSAKDKGLRICASAPLYHPEHAQGARFRLELEILSGVASNFDDVLSFTYDADQKSLRWFTEGKVGRYETEVLRSEPEADAKEAWRYPDVRRHFPDLAEAGKDRPPPASMNVDGMLSSFTALQETEAIGGLPETLAEAHLIVERLARARFIADEETEAALIALSGIAA